MPGHFALAGIACMQIGTVAHGHCRRLVRVRKLIEGLTGFLTGSIYQDAQLRPTLLGEGVCNSSVVAVK